MLTRNPTPARNLAQGYPLVRVSETKGRGSFDAHVNVTYISCNTNPHRSMPRALTGFCCSVEGDERERLAVFCGDRPEWRRFPNSPSGKTVSCRHELARAFRESRPS